MLSVTFLSHYITSSHATTDDRTRIMRFARGAHFRFTYKRDDFSLLLMYHHSMLTTHNHPIHRIPIVLPQQFSTAADTDEFRNASLHFNDRMLMPNFGGLNIDMLEDPGVARTIFHDYTLDETKFDRSEPVAADNVDAYYAFDDDRKRDPYAKRKDKKGQTCRRTKTHRRLPINCNTVYEFDVRSAVQAGNQRRLGGGAYRDVHLVELEGQGNYVFKTSRLQVEYKYPLYEFIRMDCLVLELFSSSPQMVHSYANCGIDQIGEAMEAGDFDQLAAPLGYQQPFVTPPEYQDHIMSFNNLTTDEKLKFALEMAEPIALLHGFPGGVIVHDDIQPSQYLLTPDRQHIRLNDFNRAEFMLWNEGMQEYCKYRNYPGHGSWRSPEEYFDDPLDEKIDVYSFGNNLYLVLTGLLPFYERNSGSTKEALKHHEKHPIDPRWRNNSFAEGKIVDLIEKCWAFKPEDRPNIFDIVKYLRMAIIENEKRKKQNNKERI